MGKGEIACNEQFLLFPQCFLLKQTVVSPFVHIFAIMSLFVAELEEPKIGVLGKRLKAQPSTVEGIFNLDFSKLIMTLETYTDMN